MARDNRRPPCYTISMPAPTPPKPEDFSIEVIDFEDLNFATYNPRKQLRPSDPTWRQLKKSIEKFGLVQNCVWNRRTGTLVGGHQRITICRAEWGWARFPCKVVDLDPDQERELNLILNKVGEGNWDEAKLETILTEIREQGTVDIYDLGFDPAEIERITRKREKRTRRDPDAEAPAPPTKAISKHGDLYVFITGDGETRHHLLCDDATDPDAARKVLDGTRSRVIFTDPPYGVSYVSKAKGGKIKRHDVQNDDLRAEVLQEFLQKAFGAMAGVTTDDPVAYVFYASRCHRAFSLALEHAGWHERQQLIWQKRLVLGRSDYHWAHEPMFYCSRQGRKAEWFGTRAEKTIFESTLEDFRAMNKDQLLDLVTALQESVDLWDIAQDPPSTYVHPTQKPTALGRRAMRNSSLLGDWIFDPFAGSGSTMIAAELEDRNSASMELEPTNVDVIAARFIDTFEEVVVTQNGKELSLDTFNHIL